MNKRIFIFVTVNQFFEELFMRSNTFGQVSIRRNEDWIFERKTSTPLFDSCLNRRYFLAPYNLSTAILISPTFSRMLSPSSQARSIELQASNISYQAFSFAHPSV
jgi:hypothetical protein